MAGFLFAPYAAGFYGYFSAKSRATLVWPVFRASGEIGRRASLRSWSRKGWRFKSSLAHKLAGKKLGTCASCVRT